MILTELAITENYASSEESPNSDFGISGLFYAFGDPCASLTWDETTRCASGTLCSPTSEDWGIAVGFDFDYSSDTETKYAWDPTLYGVIGVGWEISGSVPVLQAWITNMDPAWGGACTSDACEIQGPPDGKPSAGLSDYLLFSQMQKDDWGGSGVLYSFDPSAVLSLQFKIPSVIAGASSFSFCVDSIFLVR